MAQSATTEHHFRMSLPRIVIAILLFIALVSAAWYIRTHTQTAQAPDQSTEQADPNAAGNVPPTDNGSVNQGANSADDATPSPTGTSTVPGAENSR